MSQGTDDSILVLTQMTISGSRNFLKDFFIVALIMLEVSGLERGMHSLSDFVLNFITQKDKPHNSTIYKL